MTPFSRRKAISLGCQDGELSVVLVIWCCYLWFFKLWACDGATTQEQNRYTVIAQSVKTVIMPNIALARILVGNVEAEIQNLVWRTRVGYTTHQIGNGLIIGVTFAIMAAVASESNLKK